MSPCPHCRMTIPDSLARICGHCRGRVKYGLLGFKGDEPEDREYFMDGPFGKSKSGLRYNKWAWMGFGCVLIYAVVTSPTEEAEAEPPRDPDSYWSLPKNSAPTPVAAAASAEPTIEEQLAHEMERQKVLQAEVADINARLAAATAEAEMIAMSEGSAKEAAEYPDVHAADLVLP